MRKRNDEETGESSHYANPNQNTEINNSITKWMTKPKILQPASRQTTQLAIFDHMGVLSTAYSLILV